MNEHDPRAEHRDCGAEAAAYVLGALEPAEAEAFRVHLASCVVCRDEVSAFQEVVDALPASAPPHPVPRALRRRVMRDVRAEPRAGSQPTRSRGGFPGRAALRMPRPLLVACAVALAVAVGLGAGKLLSAGTSTRVLHASVNWHGSAVLRVSGGRGELIVHGMPRAPQGKVYEVWVKRAEQPPAPTSALFDATSSGSGAVDVPGNLHGVSQVMVTSEPAGGSSAPTSAPVLVAQVS